MTRTSFHILSQGRFSAWIQHGIGMDPPNLYPSVRCGLEGALLTALAQAQWLPLQSLLLSSKAERLQPGKQPSQQDETVLVNGLLDCQGSIESCVAQADQLTSQGYLALKLKVS